MTLHPFKITIMIRNKHIQTLTAILLMAILFSSCASRKRFVYWNNIEEGVEYPITNMHNPKVNQNDQLSIVVTCKNPALAAPFNAQEGLVRVGDSGEISNVVGNTSKGYRVDNEGDIDFPVLGKVHVEGLTLDQVQDTIRSLIVAGKYIDDPQVNVDLISFRYTIIGAVGGNGVQTAENGRITLLEAIADAGDVTNRARLDRVTVLREVEGVRKQYVVDLRDRALFDSPAYHLQQNDIVYVEPKYRKKDKEDHTLQYLTLLLSVASSATSIIYWYKHW